MPDQNSTVKQMSEQMDIAGEKADSLLEDAQMINDTAGYEEGGHVEWGREKLERGTEQLIQGSEFQVRGRYFNNNDGKGTF
tara:strand:- start:66 stop:308 length:243 start_codon:yes stop_codon:yes gene_type:complete